MARKEEDERAFDRETIENGIGEKEEERRGRERKREKLAVRSARFEEIFQKGNYKSGLETRGAAIKRDLYETRGCRGSGLKEKKRTGPAVTSRRCLSSYGIRR